MGFRDIFITYLENSSLHGAKFTVEKENHFTEKLKMNLIFLPFFTCLLLEQIILGDLHYIGLDCKRFPYSVRLGCISTQRNSICRGNFIPRLGLNILEDLSTHA